MPSSNNGQRNWHEVSLSLPTVIAAVSLIVTAAGAFWTIMQTEIANLNTTVAANLTYTKEQDQRIRTILDNMSSQMLRITERLNSDYVTRQEHTAYEKRIDQVNELQAERIKRLEDTHPTSGELSTSVSALQGRLDALSNAVLKLQDTCALKTK